MNHQSFAMSAKRLSIKIFGCYRMPDESTRFGVDRRIASKRRLPVSLPDVINSDDRLEIYCYQGSAQVFLQAVSDELMTVR